MKLIQRISILAILVALVSVTTVPGGVANAWKGSWKYASWGRAWIGFDATTANGKYAFGQVDDIKTDGYCVEIRLRKSGQSWPAGYAVIPGTTKPAVSCGAIVDWTYATGYESIAGARMYSGSGNYSTLYGS
jgi:hypothetical protein